MPTSEIVELVLLSVSAVALLVVVLAGMFLSSYRARRHEYYTRPTMIALIGGLLGVAAAMLRFDWTVGFWVTVGLVGWLVLEGGFWLLKKPQTPPASHGGSSKKQKGHKRP